MIGFFVAYDGVSCSAAVKQMFSELIEGLVAMKAVLDIGVDSGKDAVAVWLQSRQN